MAISLQLLRKKGALLSMALVQQLYLVSTIKGEGEANGGEGTSLRSSQLTLSSAYTASPSDMSSETS
jgi:hypothetical protein